MAAPEPVDSPADDAGRAGDVTAPAADASADDASEAPDGSAGDTDDAHDVTSWAFRIGVAPGLTVGKWTAVWAERRPTVRVDVQVVERDDAVTALREGRLDVALVRLPVDRSGLSAIPLYTEVAVVVVPKDHPVSLFESVTAADLVDEDLLQDPDEVPPWRDAVAAARTTPLRPRPEVGTTADAIALVAAGVGLLVVPQSVARLHHRKDLTYRPVSDVPPTQVALVWPEERTTPDVEEFIGIVRGRTARSSRSPAPMTSDAGARTSGSTPSGRSGGSTAGRGDGGTARGARSGGGGSRSSRDGGGRGGSSRRDGGRRGRRR